MIDHTKHRGAFVFLALFAAVILLGACGDSNKKSTAPAAAASVNDATAVGINVCTTCHTVATTDWLTSKHANAEEGINSAGSPTLGGNYTPGSCGLCHDPNGDSANIIAAGYIGSVARPVVGCEACHGPGSLHANAGGAGAISLLSGHTSTSIGRVVSGQFRAELLNFGFIGNDDDPTRHLNIRHRTQYAGLYSLPHRTRAAPVQTRYGLTDARFCGREGKYHNPCNQRE
jgi:hypothetical protein